jgi:hypothetical protein
MKICLGISRALRYGNCHVLQKINIRRSHYQNGKDLCAAIACYEKFAVGVLKIIQHKSI